MNIHRARKAVISRDSEKSWTDIKVCRKSDPVRLTDEHVMTIAEKVNASKSQVREILHLINFKYGTSDHEITVFHEDGSDFGITVE
jgi:hypothetical protein